ncbi:hypothetical protein [Profundibacterium mesophilum]|uniref:Two-component system cell cycle sensor kinase and response regulator n=1 Tax=Profundibacterium mesophilum KAUST100406-0324 TaxID=1037889 RepID=A0A921TB56_9RHOB|nr:hypothetical protein [Profundibacterium mesophilum]KAF0674910.1 two-component system cell cycle sensor kinase and response regulator [Profundibacterium mesophilum KAUST100406-0324]
MRAGLSGRTILVLEDEPLIAFDLEMTLEDAGASVLGPTHSEAEAMAAIDAVVAAPGEPVAIDCAVLDVHLGANTCEAVALRLVDMEIPLVLHSGHAKPDEGFIRRLAAPIVRKPAPASALVDVLISAISETPNKTPFGQN